MIAIVRIRGQVGLDRDIIETFNRLGLKRKYSCKVFVNPSKIELGMVKKLKDFVAYGELNEEIYKELIEKRKSKKENFFRLHPPRGGIDSKKHFTETKKGVLGDNKEQINDLIKRMI